MSWLFSQALVEEYSADTCSDGEQSAQWSVMPTPQGFWRNDKMMEASSLSRFGPTLQLLTAGRGADVLMSYLADFPARTSVLQEEGRGSVESVAGCGPKWRASFARYDRDSCSWKTHQHSLLGGLDEFSETWPRWGLMCAGECWERQTWAPHMSATESGSQPLFPTVTRRDYRSDKGGEAWTQKRKAETRGQSLPFVLGGLLNPPWIEWLMGWPQGWTELKPLATGRFREWRRQHSTTCRGEGEE